MPTMEASVYNSNMLLNKAPTSSPEEPDDVPENEAEGGTDQGVTGTEATSSKATALAPSTKRHVEAVALCRHCNRMIMTIHIFGDASSLSKPYILDFACLNCASTSTDLNSAPSKKRKRKKSENGGGRDVPVECKMCGKHSGYGGVRLVTECKSDEFVWVDPEFGTEMMCCDCTANFRFCTNCGGGGKFRSGKWRPAQLFAPNRKNCTLDHSRLRTPKTCSYLVYRVPIGTLGSHIRNLDPISFGTPPSYIPYMDKPLNEAIDNIVKDVLEFYSFASIASGAEAMQMLMSPWADTWQKFSDWRQSNLVELERLLRGEFDPNVPRQLYDSKEYRRYLSIAIAPNTKTKKSKGHQHENTDTLGGNASKTTFSIVGFSTLNWHVTDRHIFHRFTTCLGQYSLGQGSMIPSLLLAAERRVEADLMHPISPIPSLAPLHLWAYHYMRKGQSKKNIIPELVRVGFKYLEEYAESHGISPALARDLFRNFVMPPESYEMMKILVLPWAERNKILAFLERHSIVGQE
ncbi:hypothetical protein HDU97_007432 [Phlyctochytrium planicorne]|nr:hypothetical protein HDU97_007432 [Phlyctochytrium planicorne]